MSFPAATVISVSVDLAGVLLCDVFFGPLFLQRGSVCPATCRAET